MGELTARTEVWRNAGALTNVNGEQVFVRERAGTGDQPVLLFLHGYPSSSYDWRHAFEQLEGHGLIV